MFHYSTNSQFGSGLVIVVPVNTDFEAETTILNTIGGHTIITTQLHTSHH